MSDCSWLSIVVGDDMIRLWRVTLILCIVLVDLRLSVLWYCCLIRGSIRIIALLSRRILSLGVSSEVQDHNVRRESYIIARHIGRRRFLFRAYNLSNAGSACY